MNFRLNKNYFKTKTQIWDILKKNIKIYKTKTQSWDIFYNFKTKSQIENFFNKN